MENYQGSQLNNPMKRDVTPNRSRLNEKDPMSYN